MDEIERKLAQAMQLITEVGAMLAEAKKGQVPAQVMSRIQAAQGMRQPLSMVPSIIAPPLAKPKKQKAAKGSKDRGNRAHFYLRIASAQDETNDKIFRVLGDAGLVEANRMHAELATDPSYKVERLDSREFQALVERRLRTIREGATGYVGSTSSENLTGPGVQQ